MYVCLVISSLLAINILKIYPIIAMLTAVIKIAYSNLFDSLQSAKEPFSKTSVPEIAGILGKCSDFPE